MLLLRLRGPLGLGIPCVFVIYLSNHYTSNNRREKENRRKGEDKPMLMCPDMTSISTLTHNSSIRPYSTICIQLVLAISLVIVLALSTLQAGVGLSAHANALTFFDERDFRTGADSCSYDFCAYIFSFCFRASLYFNFFCRIYSLLG